jgi:hypothetical protein
MINKIFTNYAWKIFRSTYYLGSCLLGCSAMYSGRSLPTFQRTLLPPSSESHLRTNRRENLKSYLPTIYWNPVISTIPFRQNGISHKRAKNTSSVWHEATINEVLPVKFVWVSWFLHPRHIADLTWFPSQTNHELLGKRNRNENPDLSYHTTTSQNIFSL